MTIAKHPTKWAGLFILLGMIAGVLSVTPSVDSSEYLILASENSDQVITAAIFQIIMALLYLGFAIILYPILKQVSTRLSVGFLGFRIIAATLVIMGTVLLVSILALSNEFVIQASYNKETFEAVGNMLKVTRDSINHGFMIFALSTSNILLYNLLFKSKLIPHWLSIWGIIGAILSTFASVLILYQVLEVITPEYIMLNMPTAIAEIALGVWLFLKGLPAVLPVNKGEASRKSETSLV